MFSVAIRYIEVYIKWPWNDLENDLEREICLNRGLTYLSRCSTYMFPDWAAAWMGNCVDVGWVVESSSSPSCNTNWSNASSLCSCIVLNSLFIVALLMTHKNAESNKGSYLTKNLWKQTCFQTLLLLIVAYNNKGSVPMFWELSPLRVAVILLYKVNFCFDRQQFDFVLYFYRSGLKFILRLFFWYQSLAQNRTVVYLNKNSLYLTKLKPLWAGRVLKTLGCTRMLTCGRFPQGFR